MTTTARRVHLLRQSGDDKHKLCADYAGGSTRRQRIPAMTTERHRVTCERCNVIIGRQIAAEHEARSKSEAEHVGGPDPQKKTADAVKFPGVAVTLTGVDGNVFVIVGAVRKALRRAGHRDGAIAFHAAAMACQSYDDVLRLCMATVDVC